jgi:hypothetical protein
MQTQEALPRYRLIQPFYADDQLLPEDAEIIFDGVPNDGMQPLNAAAHERMEQWLRSLPPRAKPAQGTVNLDPDTLRRVLLGEHVANAVAARPREDAGHAPVIATEPASVKIPQADPTVPLMPHVALPGQKLRQAAPTVTAVIPEAEGRVKPPKKILGTIISEKQSSNDV